MLEYIYIHIDCSLRQEWGKLSFDFYLVINCISMTVPDQGRGASGAPPLKLEKKKKKKIAVKSWFFTRNTPEMFAPPSARRNFFKCAPLNLKSWIRPCRLFPVNKDWCLCTSEPIPSKQRLGYLFVHLNYLY